MYAACSHGLASGLTEALELTPVQIIACLDASHEQPKKSGPQDILSMFGGAGDF